MLLRFPEVRRRALACGPVSSAGAAPGEGVGAALAAVRRRTEGRVASLVGVDGPSGSGKSTFARALAELAGAPLVEVDEFWTWGDSDAWWECLVEQVLVPLAAGRAARYRLRDWASDPPGQPSGPWTTIAPGPLVVVEGVSCTRRSVDHLYAVRVWVDAPAAVRLDRGVRRDGEEHRETWQAWLRTESEFFAADGTTERADLRIDGSRDLG